MIIINDEKILRKKSEPIFPSDVVLIENELKKELEWNNQHNEIKGFALAAPQIGILKRIFVGYFNAGDEKRELITFVNPVIVESIDEVMYRDEGCLSFPGQFITTKRYKQVILYDALHPNGLSFYDIESFVVQHEIDHLDGILFFDRKFTGIRKEKEIGRNDLCSCGSGKKYKKCCGK